MPLRDDLHSVLVIGSGPIVIGQAAEFDYSGTQACRALRRLGLRVALVNSNPATIMTDPDVADATYLEPLTVDRVTAVIAAEQPDALLPTLGGQTALNLAVELAATGVLERHGVELIGATVEAVQRAESRSEFAAMCREQGLPTPRSTEVSSVAAGLAAVDELGLPLVLRPSFTLGGWGGGVAHDRADLERMLAVGLDASPVGRVLVEESVLGWKEYELELMRDRADNAVVICSIENVDPMGVHTGDSVTVAPAMTLSDVEYQAMRDDALQVLRAVGVETGGANVQFAVDPATGRRLVIEMNPRVSRSSALASKATGFPIAKVAAQLAVGLTLDEIRNEITGVTAAAFEPTLDYVVVKVPRFNFEKFPGSSRELTTRMQSIGEVMAIGRTFPEALQKAWRSLETGHDGLGDPTSDPGDPTGAAVAGRAEGSGVDGPDPEGWPEVWRDRLATPTPTRLEQVHAALAAGLTVDDVAALSSIDPWFVDGVAQIVEVEQLVRAAVSLDGLNARLLAHAKRHGFSDAQLGRLVHAPEGEVRARRRALGVEPVYRSVDTCAGEFAARTPYHYSTYEEQTEVRPSERPRVIVLGSGPNRIGQGVEFDTVCVHAVQALRAAGLETVMVNCNPETVSTDYDVADRLYIEPLTLEDVLEVCRAETRAGPLLGVIVTLGGQTPLQLARGLADAGVPLLGTSPDAIDLAEDRGRFAGVLARAGLDAPPWGIAHDPGEAADVAARVGYPVLGRPSYVLGGRAMEVCYDTTDLDRSAALATARATDRPVLVDRFLDDAVEIDVDAVSDGTEVLVCGVMEHIEEAGVHSGDSACVLPPITLGDDQVAAVVDATVRLARTIGVVGCLNVQFAIQRDRLFVLEANPRASRSVPFVEKVTGLPVGMAAARVMAGASLADLRAEGLLPADPGPLGPQPPYVGVKAPVLPFARFPGADALLGPEMRSTGEVIGLDDAFGPAFAKSHEAAHGRLPTKGTAFLSVRNPDKRAIVLPAKILAEHGFTLLATSGTASVLARNGVPATVLPKVHERRRRTGSPPARPAPAGREQVRNVVERLRAGEVDVIVNTPAGSGPRADGYEIRIAAAAAGVPCLTTLSGLTAVVQGIEARRENGYTLRSLQERHRLVMNHEEEPA